MGVRYTIQADMEATSFEYIEVFYNRKPKYSTLGYRSPTLFLEYRLGQQRQEKLVA
jgi:transposase InsO family protein